MSKDYYKTLGVEKTASQDEIKKAFRKRAHKYHPDKQGGDETKFKEVNEAFQVLGDEGKRKQYDQFGADFAQQGGFGGGAGWEDFMRAARGQGGGAQFDFGGMDFGDVFGDMFGFGGGRRGRARRGNDVQVDVEISFHDAVFGIEKEINLNKFNDCEICDGSGSEPGSSKKTCDQCQGQGQVRHVQQTILGAMQSVRTCQGCQGHGKISEHPCKSCGGDGRVRNDSNYTVKIPAGIHDGGTIRLSGKGESAGTGGQTGDLYVVVHIKADKRFTRDGFDIHTETTVSYPQAVLGAEVKIETVEGEKTLVVPPGTQPEQKIRLKGLGVNHLNGSGRGHQYVTVHVDVPKKPGRKARKIIEQLADEFK